MIGDHLGDHFSRGPGTTSGTTSRKPHEINGGPLRGPVGTTSAVDGDHGPPLKGTGPPTRCQRQPNDRPCRDCDKGATDISGLCLACIEARRRALRTNTKEGTR